MSIKSPPNSDFTLGIVIITITLFASLLFVSAALSVNSKHSYKIDDVRHIEGLDEIDNIEEVRETYELSEIGLTNKQEQQIMDEKSVTMKKELKIDAGQTVALTTDNGSYIAHTAWAFPNILTETITSLVSLILFFCMIFVPIILDSRFLCDVLRVVAVVSSIISFTFSTFCIFALILL
jgi:hypothetical protein